jgi:4'-phosphopantetheinyl transferase
MSLDTEVVVVRLDLAAEPLRRLEGLLCADERDRAMRFAAASDRRRYVAARGTLRVLLAERTGIEPALLRFAAGPHGKPSLEGQAAGSGWRFNLSHAGDLAAFAFSAGREVGIDMEPIRPVKGAERIVRQFFSSRENASFAALAPQQRVMGFINAWTRKEAFAKATGEGLYARFADFDVSLEPGEPARLLRVGNAPGEACGWTLQDFSPAEDHVAALVVAQPERAAVLHS